MGGYDPSLVTSKTYGDRRPVEGEIVALLHITFKERGIKLIDARSRAMLRGEIHELMTTDEETAAPGGGANRVSAIAFFEVEVGGIAVVDDDVLLGDELLGKVAGFDMTHMPNHMNLLVKVLTFKESSIGVGEKLTIRRPHI